MPRMISQVKIRSLIISPSQDDATVDTINITWDILDQNGQVVGHDTASDEEMDFNRPQIQAVLDRLNQMAAVVLAKRYS